MGTRLYSKHLCPAGHWSLWGTPPWVSGTSPASGQKPWEGQRGHGHCPCVQVEGPSRGQVLWAALDRPGLSRGGRRAWSSQAQKQVCIRLLPPRVRGREAQAAVLSGAGPQSRPCGGGGAGGKATAWSRAREAGVQGVGRKWESGGAGGPGALLWEGPAPWAQLPPSRMWHWAEERASRTGPQKASPLVPGHPPCSPHSPGCRWSWAWRGWSPPPHPPTPAPATVGSL